MPPIHAIVTASRVNAISAAKAMPIAPGATSVFDLGYYDFGWWAMPDEQACRIVTRFTSNTPRAVIQSHPVPAGSSILSERIGVRPERQASTRRNPFSQAVRAVVVQIQTGRTLRRLSNDLDAPAAAIADLCKRRWQIELVLRWVKQTLKIRTFLGRSENAVRIQVAVALIAYLLLHTAHKAQTSVASILAFARLVKANLMHRRSAHRLLDPPPSLSACHR